MLRKKHNWTEWSDTYIGEEARAVGDHIHQVLVDKQVRVCLKCNKVEVRCVTDATLVYKKSFNKRLENLKKKGNK